MLLRTACEADFRQGGYFWIHLFLTDVGSSAEEVQEWESLSKTYRFKRITGSA